MPESTSQQGRLLIFSAPSGSGKSTIVNWLMKEHPELNLYFSVSCTSRAPRGTEQHGVEYFFLTPEEFRQRIENDEFLEYEEVYTDRFYGTLKAQVERQLAQGQNVVFDVDVKGGVNIKRFYGDRALSLFIQPPSVEELRRRLVGRGTDTPEAIENRLAKAEYELTFAPQFDHIVVNDQLAEAQQETLRLVTGFLGQSPRGRRIGLFGGSFNPVHTGHIALARQLRRQAALDEVWFMVSPQNPLKQGAADLLDDQLRLDMARQALAGEDGLVASDYEFRLPKPSYTWNTLQHLKADYPQDTFVLLIGGDNWSLFPRWQHADDIIANYQVVVYPRRGSDIPGPLPASVSVADVELLDISSTLIRERARQGLPLSGYVPPVIEPLVQKHYGC